MNMKMKSIKFLSVMLVIISVFSMTMIGVSAADTPSSKSTGHVLVIKSDSLSVKEKKYVQLTATVSNVETQPKISWTSSDTDIATVNVSGTVRGISQGQVTITATAVVDGETLKGEFLLNVVKRGNFVQELLEERQILSYQYSYIDDYYYTNDKEAWQHNFGFGKIYDFASPYLLLEYDYIRVFFTYEGKDWMIQMWKGQYGMIFFGGEIGIYNRTHSDEGVNEWTMYKCPGEEDWLKMEMTLYWQEEINGEYVRQFTREYDKYWWCTGFKNGHIRVEEPADELRLEARITFKDQTMRDLFTQGLDECGFGKKNSKDKVGLDQYATDGNDVYLIWQNISEAESTMAIKVGVGILSSLAVLPFWPLILPYVGGFAIIVLLASLMV